MIELELRDSWFDFFEFLVQQGKTTARESVSPYSPPASSTKSSSITINNDERASLVRSEPSFSQIMASIVSTDNPAAESSEEEDDLGNSSRKQ